jgi:hypothetical protein
MSRKLSASKMVRKSFYVEHEKLVDIAEHFFHHITQIPEGIY